MHIVKSRRYHGIVIYVYRNEGQEYALSVTPGTDVGNDVEAQLWMSERLEPEPAEAGYHGEIVYMAGEIIRADTEPDDEALVRFCAPTEQGWPLADVCQWLLGARREKWHEYARTLRTLSDELGLVPDEVPSKASHP